MFRRVTFSVWTVMATCLFLKTATRLKLISPRMMAEKTIIFLTFLLLFVLAILFHLRHFYDDFVSKLNQSIEHTGLPWNVAWRGHKPPIAIKPSGQRPKR